MAKKAVIPKPNPEPSPTEAQSLSALMQLIQPSARERWSSPRANSYTPERIEDVLRSAVVTGDLYCQWELFDLMEDTWPRLAKNLGELKRSVCSRHLEVEPWNEEGQDPTETAKTKAQLVKEALSSWEPRPDEDQNGWGGTIRDLMDAWGKGVSVLEILWEIRARSGSAGGFMAAPRATTWVSPQYYGLPSDGALFLGLNLRELMSRRGLAPGADLSIVGVPTSNGIVRFPENKFVIAIAKAKSGSLASSALLRPLAFLWCASNFSGQWLLNFAQLFGIPIRWATYDPSRPDLVKTIAAMMANLGSAGWAAFPNGTNLNLADAAKGGSDNPQAYILQVADKACDILVLGQTLTTELDTGGSLAAAKVHQGVHAGVCDAACKWVAEIIESQIVSTILELNFGDETERPRICLEDEVVADPKALAERDEILMRNGMPMPKAWLYQRHGVPIPQDGEDVIEKPEPQPMPTPLGPGPIGAIAAKESTAKQRLADNVAEQVTGVAAEWLEGARPYFTRLVKMAEDPEVSDAEFLRVIRAAQLRVPEQLGPTLKPEAIATALEKAMGAACINGAVGAYLKRKAAA